MLSYLVISGAPKRRGLNGYYKGTLFGPQACPTVCACTAVTSNCFVYDCLLKRALQEEDAMSLTSSEHSKNDSK